MIVSRPGLTGSVLAIFLAGATSAAAQAPSAPAKPAPAKMADEKESRSDLMASSMSSIALL